MSKPTSICSFCCDEIYKKKSYTVLVKAIQFDVEYKTVSCKGCLDNARIVDVLTKPKKK